ncbi:MAG TPA: hypothetical protein VJ883_02705 [Woeseiaceae bacterium]|nr:hypothetical protein [Woeseiaceae bacterium]
MRTRRKVSDALALGLLMLSALLAGIAATGGEPAGKRIEMAAQEPR